MKKNSNFDKRGFLFFIKFVSSISLLVILAHYSVTIFSENVLLAKFYNIASADTQLAAITHNRQRELLAQENQESLQKLILQMATSSDKIRLGFVGDIMLDRAIADMIMENGFGDFSFPFDFVEDKLKEYDILFGNLEGSISDKGKDMGAIYSFRMDPQTADALAKVGFDVMSVANNHAGDWGREAMIDTYSRLNEAGIIYSGGGFTEHEAYTPKIIEQNGLKIAYVSFSEFGKGYLEAFGNNPGIAIISENKLKESIKKAKEEADIILVSFHYGDEYADEPNLYQEEISKKAIDYGADMVIGHHSHVPEPVIKYKDGYIAYSLGNFVFDQNFPEDGSDVGLILEALIEDSGISEVNVVKVKFNYMFQPFVVK